MNRRQQRRMAIRVARTAAREYLGIRVGTFLRKLKTGDADAQMAFYAAAEDEDPDIDISSIQKLLEMILEFIAALQAIFNW